MWKRLGSLLLIGVLLAAPAVAAVTGDPVDGNDRPVSTNHWEVDCARAALYPQCNWCMTQCVFAIIADMWSGGGISWDWGAR